MQRADSSQHLRRRGQRARRGVASILAMMFLVIFGSLAAAMAVVAQGNMRTADSSIKVSRAMSAAETGLTFARRRMASEARRFVIRKGVVDDDYAEDLWLGTYIAGDGSVEVLDPTGYTGTPSAGMGVAEAIRDAHLLDSGTLLIDPGDSSLPAIDEFGALRVRPMATASGTNPPYFRLRYELLAGDGEAGGPMIRVTSEGHDRDVTRILQADFALVKRIEYAVISPNRIMIGKNVAVEGPLGTRYGLVAGELDNENGDPLVMRSDFYYLDDGLDATLDAFFGAVALSDVDGDARLRPDHPVEGLATVDGVAIADLDYDGNEYVDDFDLFLAAFDSNADGVVVYDSDLAAAAGWGIMADEFTGVDDQMARLIDESVADRNGDGFVSFDDTSLGYQDGVLEVLDLYAKVHGRLAFAVNQVDWELAHGASYQTVVRGPVDSGLDVAPVMFEAGDQDLLEITTDMFLDSQTWFEAQVPAEASPAYPPDTSGFDAQVTAGVSGGGTYTPAASGTWESVPFGSSGAYDHYQRPHYQDMTFTNVRIPMGNNGLYENCTFIGVAFVESTSDCTHENWNYTGSVEPEVDPDTGAVTYELRFPDISVTNPYDGTPASDTRVFSNNIRFHNCTFLGSISGTAIAEYTHWRNKVQFTGNTRFYIDPTDPDLLDQPDAATLVAQLNGIDPVDRANLARSSMLLPGWSADVGNFTNEIAVNPADTPIVKLKGAIIAGILDIRGTALVDGTLVMTFRPAADSGPLFYGGQPDAFNTTIGYFGALDGDSEGVGPEDPGFNGFGEIRLRYDPDILLPDGIPWPVQMDFLPETYVEGSSS